MDFAETLGGDGSRYSWMGVDLWCAGNGSHVISAWRSVDRSLYK